MKLATLFIAVLSLAAAAPASDDDDGPVVVTTEFFPDEFVVYTSEHDIVSLTVPLNAANFDDNDDLKDDNLDIMTVFVEADIKADGKYDYKGLYTLKNGTATKILETGTDSATDNSNSKLVYLSATDGIYVYNDGTGKVEKYGSVTDNLVGIRKLNASETLYVLTADHVVYKVTDHGNKKVKVDAAHGARDIEIDFSDRLYFFGEDKQPYVVIGDSVKKIEGLPANPISVSLVRPLFVIDDGVLFVSDDKLYVLYANGTSEFGEFELQVKPTACALEATLFDFVAYNKKIYEYNVFVLLGYALEALKSFLEDKTAEIHAIATRSRATLKP